MGSFPLLDRKAALSPAVVALLLHLARPLLRLHFVSYKRDLRRAPFPEDDPEVVIAGPDADRLLFIGDVAVAGYGVLHHGMTAVSLTARFVALASGRGCTWETVTATEFSVARLAKMAPFDATDVDVAVLMLGVPDVLLATNPKRWAADLRTIIDRIRFQAGPECRIVLAAIPPMGDFRPIPAFARQLMTLQIQRLNRVTQIISSQTSNASFIPFPAWRVGELYIQELFSWKFLHQMWAQVLASAISQILNNGIKPATDTKPS